MSVLLLASELKVCSSPGNVVSFDENEFWLPAYWTRFKSRFIHTRNLTDESSKTGERRLNQFGSAS